MGQRGGSLDYEDLSELIMGIFSVVKDLIRQNVITYLLFIYVFIVSSVFINFLMLLTAVFIWPFNKELYRKINYGLAWFIWAQFTCVGQWFSNCECILYMDPEDKKHVLKEHIPIIMNHTYEIDWVLAWIVCERYGVLGGTKIYGKQALGFIPIIGWTWYFTESMFLKRDWRKDREIIDAGLKKIIAYPDDYWVSLLLFPEGTRFTKEKHKASLEVAKMKGYPEYKYHLLPRTRGFVMSVQAMKGKKNVNAIYDCTMAFPADVPEPSLMNMIRGRKQKSLGHLRVKRIELSSMPDSDEELSQFLRDLFKEKDDVLDNFYKTGKMDRPAHMVPWRIYDLLNWIFWAVVTCVPLFKYLGTIFLSGTLFQQAVVITVFTLASLLSRWMIAFSETDKGSSYGKEVTINKENKKE